jgi:hypothetical protein
MRLMRSFAPPSWVVAAAVFTMSCTPAVESQSSSATNPSSWSSNESDAAASSAPKATAPDKPTRWELADRLSTFRKAAPRARSQHLGGEHDAEVLANDVATAYPTLGPLRALPAGSALVEALYAPNQADVAAYFAMVKQASAAGSSWEYLVVSSSGMVEQRGALTLCARCHAEAPHDHVFGRPR